MRGGSDSLRLVRQLAAALLFFAACSAGATVSVVDDSGASVTLPAPARRIISLAPHTTELLFAAGAGHAVVGVSEASDFPEQAKQRASVGNSARVDLERIIDLRPDLVVGWKSGNAARQLARLRQLGIPVFESEPRNFEDIASSLERLAVLAGTEPEGKQAAQTFRQQLEDLRRQEAGRAPVRVFYQIWPSPLMTLNDAHLASQALMLCGARNIFGGQKQLAPTVNPEAVVRADPDAIILSDERPDAATLWQRFGRLRAVKKNQVVRIDGTLINRAGPRILSGTAHLCKQIELIRQSLPRH
jgi:iron complex transport system substrate-binding protein